MPPLRVSIVIVNWKTPKLLSECLDSIALDPQSAQFEIWVVDNNSADGSVELLSSRYSYVKVLANDFNAGFSKGCNQVIPLCSAPYILLLNPDTKVHDRAISKLAEFLDNHSQCGAVGPKVLNFDGTLQLACRRAFPDPVSAFFRITYLSRLFPKNPTFSRYNYSFQDPEKPLSVDALSGSCMMVRRSVVESVGLLDEDIFMFGEDIDWCWRIKQAKWTVDYYPSAVVYHMHGAASRFRPVGTTIDLHKGMYVFYKKHLAQKYWAPFNWLVYAAIWSRAGIFVLVNWSRALVSHSAAKQVDLSLDAKKLELNSVNLSQQQQQQVDQAAGKKW
jgi:GT2 family glycosyltransferase